MKIFTLIKLWYYKFLYLRSIKRKQKQGLVDTKFFWKEHERNAYNNMCCYRELVEMDRAIHAGKHTPLDFGGLRWKKAS